MNKQNNRQFQKVYFLVQVSNGYKQPVFHICARTYSKELMLEMQEALKSLDPSIVTKVVEYTRDEFIELGYC